MKKKLLITLCIIVLYALTLTGCGTEVANSELPNSSGGNSSEQTKDQSSQNGFFSKPNVSDTIVQLEQLKTDLAEFVAIFSNHSLEINDMEIVKRQTTVEDKTDIVYVAGTAVNDIAQYNFYYKMTYNLYNDGWILDEVEKDDKNECYSQPLKGPDEQQIYYDVESYYSYEYSRYDEDNYSIQYQIEKPYDNFSDGLYSFTSNGAKEYDTGEFNVLDNWAYLFDDGLGDSNYPYEGPKCYYLIEEYDDNFSDGTCSFIIKLVKEYEAGALVNLYIWTYVFDDSEMLWKYKTPDWNRQITIYDLDGVWVGEDYSVEVSLSDFYDLSTMFVTVTDLRSNEVIYSGTATSSIGYYYVNFLNRNRHPVRDIVTGEILYYDNYGDHEYINFSYIGVTYRSNSNKKQIYLEKIS